MVARWAHNPKVVGSNPAPATKIKKKGLSSFLHFKMYIVYVIKSIEGLTYIGQTNDINRRLKEHNKGLSRWTKRGADWKSSPRYKITRI